MFMRTIDILFKNLTLSGHIPEREAIVSSSQKQAEFTVQELERLVQI
jgi:hypothetical protein